MPNPRLLYTLLLWLLLPYALLHLLWRARKQPAYLQHIGERFGFYAARGERPVVWLHTVSVGETRAAASLVQALRAAYPQHQILLTHTTPTGREASEQLYGDAVRRVYLPYDYPFAVRRFVRHFRPSVGVLLETEIWFNLIHTCHIEAVPLLLLNARLSEKSAARYARYPKLVRTGLRELHGIAAQTQLDAERLAALGAAQVTVMGNLKFDIAPPAAMLQLGAELRQQWGKDRAVFLAASTREGEEKLLLDALSNLNSLTTKPPYQGGANQGENHISPSPDKGRLGGVSGLTPPLLVIVPRHPQRFNEVAALLKQHSIPFQRRSEHAPIRADTRVLLGDSMGELFAYYAACDLAFIGGSLLPFGGQNLIEACAVGRPVLLGAHTYNFAQASEQAVLGGAAIRVTSAQELMQQAQNVLSNPAQMQQMREAAWQFVRAHQGATQLAVQHIQQGMRSA